MLIWKVCLIAAIVSFAVLAVVTTIGGAMDIRRLFVRLRDGEDS